MILKPTKEDIRNIGFYLGKIIVGLGLIMLIPLLIGLVACEINPALDFLIGAEIALVFGFILIKLCHTERDLSWMQGMIVVALSWLAATLLGAVPMYLSGHWNSFLDACFEAMSGFATTGLTLVQDLDHLSYAHNFWRHLGPFVGGQGIVIVALSLFLRASSGAFKLYVGEAREEKILPNIIHTARFIWLISLVYLVLGTIALGAAGIFVLGLKPVNALFHGACIFMAGFDTAGFSPQSQNILYYHSLLYECIIIIIMILGALNFNFHYQLWAGKFKEAVKNIESKAFFISIMLFFLVTSLGLEQAGIYPGLVSFFRKGFFQFISGHSTTGYMTIYAQQFIKEWGNLALAGLICSMALGGFICSTSGGVKMLRIGIIFKALFEDIKRLILPEKAIFFQRFHHVKDVLLDDKQVRSALLITLAYIILYAIGTLVGVFYGYPFLESLFESTSAAANVGFSCGITNAGMPDGLKLTYIFQMWAGRLEFMSIFTLAGFFVAAIRGKR